VRFFLPPISGKNCLFLSSFLSTKTETKIKSKAFSKKSLLYLLLALLCASFTMLSTERTKFRSMEPATSSPLPRDTSEQDPALAQSEDQSQGRFMFFSSSSYSGSFRLLVGCLFVFK